MIHGILRQGAIAACLAVGQVSTASGEAVPTEWKTDCVGRMQISLPGEVEVGAMTAKDFLAKISGKGDEPNKFQNGQVAGWSHFEASGLLLITHPITPNDKERIETQAARLLANAKQYLASQKFPPLVNLSSGNLAGVAWRSQDAYQAYFFIGTSAISWSIDTTGDDMPRAGRAYDALSTSSRPRNTFEIPQEAGVCLPYFFIRDESNDEFGRRIGTTYRLTAHPDITVWLEDGSAARIGPQQNPAKFTAQAKAAFFWEQRYQNRQSFKSLWPLHFAFKPTTLAGQKGVKTFVELTRRDGVTLDLGYLVAVRGDPEAEEDTPDLMLYVIQDSINARQKGIEPLGREAFLELAETIAASVKRRPVARQ